MPQQPSLRRQGESLLTFVQMRQQHLEPSGKLTANLGIDRHTTSSGGTSQKNKLFLYSSQAHASSQRCAAIGRSWWPPSAVPAGRDPVAPGSPGPGLLAAPDILGTSAEIAEKLYADAAFRREVREVVFALPFSFDHADYVQILTDIATSLGPALGWKPAP